MTQSRPWLLWQAEATFNGGDPLCSAHLRPTDFRAWIHPIKGEESEDKFDYRVVVQRLTDGTTKQTKVSGGWTIAEAYCNLLAHDLGLDPEVDL